jgi:outer membrane protein OmpA-like peptidoglycan-associated protein
MAIDIIETVKGVLTPAVVEKASTLAGESPATTGRAFQAGVPALLAGLLHFGESKGGPDRLLAMVNQYGSSDVLANPSAAFAGGSVSQGLMSSGRDILDTIFGGRLGAITELVSRFSGARGSSSSSLLSLAAPLVLSVLGRAKSSQGLDASALVRLLARQRDSIARAAPAGLANTLGLGSLDDLASGAASRVSEPVAAQAAGRESARRWVPLVVLAAVFAGLWYFMRGRTPTPAGESPTAGVRRSAGELAAVTLPDGNTVQIPRSSSLYELVGYLGSADATVPKRFVIERLNFETDSTRLTPDSAPALDELSVILKAYPSTAMRLEGHTDNSGDPEANQRLSLARAEAVKSTLGTRGIDVSRIETVGRGPTQPITSNDTESGRAQNRRLELVVMKK